MNVACVLVVSIYMFILVEALMEVRIMRGISELVSPDEYGQNDEVLVTQLTTALSMRKKKKDVKKIVKVFIYISCIFGTNRL